MHMVNPILSSESRGNTDAGAVQRLLGELFRAPSAVQEVLSRLSQAVNDGHTGITLHKHDKDLLVSAGLTSPIPGGDQTFPLIVDGDWLCSRRVWMHEKNLASQLVMRARQSLPLNDPELDKDISDIFPASSAALAIDGIDWQKRAADIALTHGLSVITGGPGCGKTTVAGRIAGLIARSHKRRNLPLPVIVLAAPTGKASARLAESVRHAMTAIGLSSSETVSITGWSSTLHRLFNHPNIAHVDLAIIDETSMASASTLNRVLSQLPPRARAVLLGDPDQLASVEAGRVLGDIAAVTATHPLAQVSVRLRVNWRSGEAPALAALVRDLQEGTSGAERQLEAPIPATMGGDWIHRTDLLRSPHDVIHSLINAHASWIRDIITAADPAAALALVEYVRLLSVLRQGPWGSDHLNDLWEQQLCKRHALRPDSLGHYQGRLLLVTGNRPDLDLANGDIGMCWPDANGYMQIHFPTPTGTLAIPVHRLDQLVPAWFLTIHKAQGSQGQHVEVIGLPPDANAGQKQLATREMAYTAITRSAKRLRVWWDADGLAQSLNTRELARRRSNFPVQLERAATDS